MTIATRGKRAIETDARRCCQARAGWLNTGTQHPQFLLSPLPPLPFITSFLSSAHLGTPLLEAAAICEAGTTACVAQLPLPLISRPSSRILCHSLRMTLPSQTLCWWTRMRTSSRLVLGVLLCLLLLLLLLLLLFLLRALSRLVFVVCTARPIPNPALLLWDSESVISSCCRLRALSRAHVSKAAHSSASVFASQGLAGGLFSPRFSLRCSILHELFCMLLASLSSSWKCWRHPPLVGLAPSACACRRLPSLPMLALVFFSPGREERGLPVP